MEDSFRVRVDKAFGSLEPTTEPSSLSSLWSLTDEEIKRIEWNRRRDDHPDDTEPKPYPSKFDGFVAKLQNLSPPGETASIADLNDLSDGCVDSSSSDSDEEEEKEKGKKSVQLTKPEDHDDEEWDIRTSVGLDCTLDFEEEEDEFDKTAVGSDDAGDRIYMKDITGNMADDISFYDELPETFEDASRDPRANHTAAKLRLIEDAETTGKFDSLRVSDTQNRTEEEDATNLKSILKRKEKQVDPKLEKRVRFDPECNDDEEEGATVVAKQVAAFQAAVPDYIRNPSKYKHYTFDSLGDLDEESNRNACMSFLNQVMKSDDPPTDLQKPVRFTPRKKPSDTMMKNESSISNKGGATISIAAEELQQGSGTCDMEEDEAAIKTSGSLKRGRRYRTKDDLDLDELANV